MTGGKSDCRLTENLRREPVERGFAFARTLGDAMQPALVNNLLPNASPQQAAGVLTLKVLAGDVTAVGTGSVVRAEVMAVAQGRAELQVNGQPLTVRAQPALTPGTELAVQVTPSGGVEAVVIPPTPAANPNTQPTTVPPPAPAVVVVAKTAVPQAATSPVAATLTTPSQVVAPQPAAAPIPQRVSTDGTVSPTSASAAAPGRPATAIAPAPPTVTQPTVIDPNVPVRTTTPAATQVAGQLVPAVAPRSRQTTADTATARATPTTAAANVPQGRGPRTPLPVQLSVVEVLTPARDGSPRVRIDGRPQQLAESVEPLTPGTKFVAQVERTPAGVRIVSAPTVNSPQQTVAVAAALLKQDRPLPVAQALPQLAKELAAVPVPANRPAVAEAVSDVQQSVKAILPDTPRPPNAEQLKSLVEDGGQKYEGKLARQTDGGDGPNRTDLKGALLRLFEAVPAVAHSQYPAAKLTLDGIEQQQAANVLAQQSGGPMVLQVPFPDGPHWRTMHLAVEPEQYAGKAVDERTRPFRMLMHVPLSELGDTWIDAGMSGSQFRAVLYLEEPGVRDRVRTELPELRSDLSRIGFTDVLLDVRPTADLTDRQRQQGAAMTSGVPSSTTVINARA